MIEKGFTERKENWTFEEKASKIFKKSRINPLPNDRFGKEWTEKHSIQVRTFGHQALMHLENHSDQVKEEIVLGIDATEKHLLLRGGHLLLEEIDYWSKDKDSLIFLKTKSYRKNRSYYILLSHKKGGDEAYVIDRKDGSENARINYFPDGLQLRNSEYRTSYIREKVSPTEATSRFWLELNQDLKRVERENLLPSVSEEWSNYDLGI